jgi:hypothetical protein
MAERRGNIKYVFIYRRYRKLRPDTKTAYSMYTVLHETSVKPQEVIKLGYFERNKWFRFSAVTELLLQTTKKTKLSCLSPQVNYTDRATTACRRS